MPRKFFKRYTPDHDKIRSHRHLRALFGSLLHDPNLFHLNRRSVSGAFGIGLLSAWMVVPSQMVLAAALAIVVRVNLPLSVALVWITNPVTIPPMFYSAYKLGSWILGKEPGQIEIVVSWEWVLNEMVEIWQPLLLGSLVLGVLSGTLGFLIIRLIWRWQMIRQWHRRKRARALKKRNLSER